MSRPPFSRRPFPFGPSGCTLVPVETTVRITIDIETPLGVRARVQGDTDRALELWVEHGSPRRCSRMPGAFPLRVLADPLDACAVIEMSADFLSGLLPGMGEEALMEAMR